MREIVKNSTSITLNIVLRDSTTGLGLTGKVFSDITGSYTRNRAARTAITMATLASPSAAWSSGGFVEVDATNCPGLYRFDVPDAAFATGVRNVVISAKATGAITEHEEVILTGWDNQDAVRGGLTALPNAAAGATNGLACVVAFGGTATAGGASTITLPSPASTVAQFYKGLEISIIGGTGAGQSAIITDYTTGRVATVSKPWATNPDNTSVIEVRDIAGPPLDANLKVLGVVLADSLTALANNAITAASIAADAITAAKVADGTIDAATFAAGAINAAAIATDAITAAKIAADAIGASELATDAVTEIQAAVAAGSVASVVGAVGSVTGNVGGNVVGSVGSIATGGIVAASFAVDSITSGALSNGACDEISDHVWDELLSGHVISGSTGAALTAAGSAGDPWGTALPGAYGAGTAGAILGTNLDATISTRATPAQVNTEVVDALNVDTYAEPSAVPAATATLAEKIGFLMALARNKITQTATTQLLRNAGDTATIATSTDSDDGTTYTRGGFV